MLKMVEKIDRRIVSFKNSLGKQKKKIVTQCGTCPLRARKISEQGGIYFICKNSNPEAIIPDTGKIADFCTLKRYIAGNPNTLYRAP